MCCSPPVQALSGGGAILFLFAIIQLSPHMTHRLEFMEKQCCADLVRSVSQTTLSALVNPCRNAVLKARKKSLIYVIS